MTLDEKLKKKLYGQIWEEYCGFLDFTMDEYLSIQRRLLMEQIEQYYGCELGRRFMKDGKPTCMEEFRRTVPLTAYEDYADILLQKREDALPEKPLTWIETTWEGGKNPVKLAPYTSRMIHGHKCNFIACMIFATSSKKGSFTLRRFDRFLYGMAPLPYLTGIVPFLLKDELTVEFLPSTKEAVQMSFGERNKAGFKLGMKNGIDLFFGLSSVITRMSEGFGADKSGSFKPHESSLKMNCRIIRAWLNSKINHTAIMPKDIWKLKGLLCAGTDTASYKDKITKYWGLKPLELFGGTEPTIIATETWSKNGMVFFPDVCFYEFIPETEMDKNAQNPQYVPKTYLINELLEGRNYEVVITNFKGGAFCRYRVGDVFKCLSLENRQDGIKFPQFAYVDRVPEIIDIAGFTRITETTIAESIRLSKLDISDWFALKEYDEQKRAYMHLFLEVGSQGICGAVTTEIIKEQLTIYFKYIDNDYKDLKRMLGIDPLMVTIIPTGTLKTFKASCSHFFRRLNPSPYDVTDILKIANSGKGGYECH